MVSALLAVQGHAREHLAKPPEVWLEFRGMSAVKVERISDGIPLSKFDNLRHLWSRKAGGANITSLFTASVRVFSLWMHSFLVNQEPFSRRPNLGSICPVHYNRDNFIILLFISDTIKSKIIEIALLA